MNPGDVIFRVQLALAAVVAIAYFWGSLRRDRDGALHAKRLPQIVTAVTSALILPFGAVIVYSAYDLSALDWLKEGNYRFSLFVIGVGAIVYAVTNLFNNWPR